MFSSIRSFVYFLTQKYYIDFVNNWEFVLPYKILDNIMLSYMDIIYLHWKI